MPNPSQLPEDSIREAVQRALDEDLQGREDITTKAVVPEDRMAQARIFSRSPGLLAGMPVALEVFRALDPEVQVVHSLQDGAFLEEGTDILVLRGRAWGLLGAERSALNFLAKLSGIATMTREFVERLAGTGVAILETRKTTPGLRRLEKYAVSVGGGENHRLGLYDKILLKENHFALSVEGTGPGAYKRTVARAVRYARGKGPVAAEARTLEEALAAVEGGADIVLLDNMSPPELEATVSAGKRAAREVGREVLFEASGGVRLENVLEIARTGVDRISVGAITHSALPLDLSMLVTGL